MGRGSGTTPVAVVEAVKELVAKHGQAGTSRLTGLGLATINDYLNGKGEPTAKTIQKLANYTGKEFTIVFKPER